MELFSDLDDVVIRPGPRRTKTEEILKSVGGNGSAAKLLQDAAAISPDYLTTVQEYLKIFADYQKSGKSREIITDLEKILIGINTTKNLSEDDIRAIRIRNSYGSWDIMLKDIEEKSKTRQLYKIVNNHASEEQEKRIRELQALEQKFGIDLADYCLVL